AAGRTAAGAGSLAPRARKRDCGYRDSVGGKRLSESATGSRLARCYGSGRPLRRSSPAPSVLRRALVRPRDARSHSHFCMDDSALPSNGTASESGSAFYLTMLDELPIGIAVYRLDDPDDPGSLRLVQANAAAARAVGFDVKAEI